jgi:RNA polymerase primary sigma factor
VKGFQHGNVEGPDALRLYLKEISRFPQLTPADERRIGEAARNGDRAALETLIESNLRFVVSMAKRYAKSGYPLHELINEGNMGLIEAASRFDPDRGVRFVTYAGWWVRQALLTAIAHYGQAFHIPARLKYEHYLFETRVGKLAQALGRRPSVEEISKELEMEEDAVRTMIGGPPREVSINATLGVDSDTEFGEMIEDRATPPLDEALMRESFERQIHALLERLDPRERSIVERRFGLNGGEPETLAEIGASLNVTRERIRQIEANALSKLRRSHSARRLLGHLN